MSTIKADVTIMEQDGELSLCYIHAWYGDWVEIDNIGWAIILTDDIPANVWPGQEKTVRLKLTIDLNADGMVTITDATGV